MGQLLDPNHASILKSAAAAGQASGQVLHGAAGAMSPQIQSRNPQLPGSTPDIKTEMNPVLNPRAAGPKGALIGIPGSNQGGNNLTLKGWPLTTAVMLLGGEELHLVAMASRKNDGRCLCFWGFNVVLGLYNSCLVMLNLRCLGIVFDLDETLKSCKYNALFNFTGDVKFIIFLWHVWFAKRDPASPVLSVFSKILNTSKGSITIELYKEGSPGGG